MDSTLTLVNVAASSSSRSRRRPYQITPPGSAALAEVLADMWWIARTGLLRLGLDPA